MTRFSVNRFIPVFLAVFSIFFNMNTLPMALYFTNAQYAVITLIIYSSILLYGIFSGISRTINRKTFLFFVFISGMVVLTSLLNHDSSILYWVLILELYKALVVSMFLDFEEFVRIYIKTVYVLALLSIILHASIMVIPGIQGLGRIAYNSNNIPFYSFGIYYKSLNESFRNYGFLTEPGDYQHYLNTALLLYFFSSEDLKKVLSKKVPIVLTIATITTFSPVGLVYLGCVWLAYFFDMHRQEKFNWKIVFAAAIAGIVIVMSPLFQTISTYTLAKLNGSSTNSRSIRLDGMLVGWKYFLEKPFFGLGCTDAISKMSGDLFLKYGGGDQTSTVFGYLAMFGIFTTILLVGYFLKCLLGKHSSKPSLLSCLFIFAGLMMTINNERFIWELTYYIFVIYGVMPSRKSKTTNNIRNIESSSMNV